MHLDDTDDFEQLEESDDTLDVHDEEIVDDETLLPIIREDKIFNNRYNSGDGLTSSEEYVFSKKISVSNDYSDSYLKNIYEYEEGLEIKLILDTIFQFLQSDHDISSIVRAASVEPFVTKAKLSREQVNFIFTRINESIELKSSAMLFYSPIYILEVISSISSIEYKKLFDMLDTEIQELLLVELNKKYQFLEGKMHKKRIH